MTLDHAEVGLRFRNTITNYLAYAACLASRSKMRPNDVMVDLLAVKGVM